MIKVFKDINKAIIGSVIHHKIHESCGV